MRGEALTLCYAHDTDIKRMAYTTGFFTIFRYRPRKQKETFYTVVDWEKGGWKCWPLRTPDLTRFYFWGYVKLAAGTVKSIIGTTRTQSGVYTDETVQHSHWTSSSNTELAILCHRNKVKRLQQHNMHNCGKNRLEEFKIMN
jgi:hypothetical protein